MTRSEAIQLLKPRVLGRFDRVELHGVAWFEEEGFCALEIERLERRAADDLPPARRRRRIDAGLKARDPDRAWRDLNPRNRQARRGNPLVDRTHVREARHEAEHEHAIDTRGVDADGLRFAHAGKRGDLSQIRSELPPVTHRHPYGDGSPSGTGLRLVHRPVPRTAGLDSCHERVVVREKRFEIDGDRSIRRHDVANTRDAGRPNRLGEPDGHPVDHGIDPVGELHHERGVPRRHDAGLIHASARSSF